MSIFFENHIQLQNSTILPSESKETMILFQGRQPLSRTLKIILTPYQYGFAV